MFDLLMRNIVILHIGAALRYLYKRYLKHDKSVSYSKVLNGLEKVSSKKDEIYIFHNELKNRFVAILFALVIIALILILS